MGIWERLNNPNFKLIEFDEIKNKAGTNRFSMSPKQWIEKTSSIGIISIIFTIVSDYIQYYPNFISPRPIF